LVFGFLSCVYIPMCNSNVKLDLRSLYALSAAHLKDQCTIFMKKGMKKESIPSLPIN
jgi:hypothetical protein